MTECERCVVDTNPVIQVRAANKVYRNGKQGVVKSLEPITFDVFSGELVSVIGPSGCGKTTLLKLIAGFTHCTSGEILVDGQPVESPSPDRTMIFQEYNLFPWKTLMQNVEFGLKAQGMGRNQRMAIAQRYIDLFHLSGFENWMPHQLSGGMRQRVALARALVIKPSCILMDEPFGALDAQLRNQLQNELNNTVTQMNHTILFVTHDIEEAVYLSDRIVVLSKRPACVRKIIQVRLPRPRKIDVKSTAAFQRVKSVLLELLP